MMGQEQEVGVTSEQENVERFRSPSTLVAQDSRGRSLALLKEYTFTVRSPRNVSDNG